MPLLIAPLVALALGVLFGFGLGLPERAADLDYGRRSVALFALLTLAPTVGYFAWSAPSWSVAYLWNGERIASALLMTAVLVVAALVVAGFELAQRAITDGHPRRALAGGFAASIGVVLVLAALAGRFWQVGSYAEVSEGFPVANLATSPTGLGVLGMNALLAGGAWLTLVALRSRGERLARPARTTGLARAPKLSQGPDLDAPAARPRVGRPNERPKSRTRR